MRPARASLIKNRFSVPVLAIAALTATACATSSDSAQPTVPTEATRATTTTALLPLSASSTSAAPTSTAATGTTTTLPPSELANIAVATGDKNSCSVKIDGSVFCWGDNFFGELGDGTNIHSPEPVMVVGISDAVSITAGREHFCALHSTGKVSCWGRNRYGPLGNGTFVNSNRPVNVSSINDAIAISSGYSHTCALLTDGPISCWGANWFGEFGDGTSGSNSNNYPTPRKTLNVSNAVQIATGLEHTCALHRDSTISCWGLNTRGQLGNGTETDSPVPTKVLGIDDAAAIAAASNYSCALHLDSTVSCWGNNYVGQLGDGTTDDSSVPVKVLGIDDAVSIVSSPDLYLCAFREGSRITCWGSNRLSMLAPAERDPPFYDLPGPQDRRTWAMDYSGAEEIIELPNSQDIKVLSLSRWHICAIVKDGTIQCWGETARGLAANQGAQP